MLEVNGCHAGYGEAEILHGVNLRAERDEIVTIIGPNGAGKSTLIKMVMGFLQPSRGEILFDGRDLKGLRTDERVKGGIAYVPQLDNVFPSLTVIENLRMGGYLLPASQVGAKIDAQLEQFPRLAERLGQRVSTMSGGERQMLAMARALMTDPTLMLLDEPSAALSPALVDQVFETVVEINRQGRTIVIVEQEARIALAHSNRGYVLADGQNVVDDQADRILADEKVREAYLGGAAGD